MIICNKSNYLKRELNKINHKHTHTERQTSRRILLFYWFAIISLESVHVLQLKQFQAELSCFGKIVYALSNYQIKLLHFVKFTISFSSMRHNIAYCFMFQTDTDEHNERRKEFIIFSFVRSLLLFRMNWVISSERAPEMKCSWRRRRSS